MLILTGHSSRLVFTDRMVSIAVDKKMRVGSLQSPREYDDRLPLDVDLSLDLVIPL